MFGGLFKGTDVVTLLLLPPRRTAAKMWYIFQNHRQTRTSFSVGGNQASVSFGQDYSGFQAFIVAGCSYSTENRCRPIYFINVPSITGEIRLSRFLAWAMCAVLCSVRRIARAYTEPKKNKTKKKQPKHTLSFKLQGFGLKI